MKCSTVCPHSLFAHLRMVDNSDRDTDASSFSFLESIVTLALFRFLLAASLEFVALACSSIFCAVSTNRTGFWGADGMSSRIVEMLTTSSRSRFTESGHCLMLRNLQQHCLCMCLATLWLSCLRASQWSWVSRCCGPTPAMPLLIAADKHADAHKPFRFQLWSIVSTSASLSFFGSNIFFSRCSPTLQPASHLFSFLLSLSVLNS